MPRVAKKKVEEKPKVVPRGTPNTESKLALEAANLARESALEAQKSLAETTKLIRQLVESMSDKDQLVAALTKVMSERQSLPFRAIPKRDSRGLATHYDFVPLRKVTH